MIAKEQVKREYSNKKRVVEKFVFIINSYSFWKFYSAL